MANRTSNYPTNAISSMPSEERKEILVPIVSLKGRRKPETIKELENRLNECFQSCMDKSMPIGIETLCLYLGVSRMTFWNWTNGNGCSEQWQETCLNARQVIISFLEQLTLTGKISPPVAIFLLKQYGYKDTVSFDAMAMPDSNVRKTLSVTELKDIIDKNREIQTNKA